MGFHSLKESNLFSLFFFLKDYFTFAFSFFIESFLLKKIMGLRSVNNNSFWAILLLNNWLYFAVKLFDLRLCRFWVMISKPNWIGFVLFFFFYFILFLFLFFFSFKRLKFLHQSSLLFTFARP